MRQEEMERFRDGGNGSQWTCDKPEKKKMRRSVDAKEFSFVNVISSDVENHALRHVQQSLAIAADPSNETDVGLWDDDDPSFGTRRRRDSKIEARFFSRRHYIKYRFIYASFIIFIVYT